MTTQYTFERLPNGLILVSSRGSGLRSCYHADGSFRHGTPFTDLGTTTQVRAVFESHGVA